MTIERMKELKLAVGVVFAHWRETAANQRGFDNTKGKAYFAKDEEDIQKVLDEVIALEEHQAWVSVADRLPEQEDADDREMVLTLDQERRQEEYEYHKIVQWNNKSSNKITHWRPMLPEPPKEGNHDIPV